ncbi:MAG: flagellar hook-associated protein FlgK [Betaproteobacteria bacterium]|nr:flagellar hook-associated protein FlgK [Betaproteobacteria bacterium]
MSLVSTGVTGLIAAQMGLQTTGHNIANASTPGYNRQTLIQTTNTPMFSSAGFFGQGTNVSNITRIYNDFQSKQVLSSETTAAQLSTYSTEISQIDNMLADPNAGLSPAMQAFFNALEEASANPASIPARQSVLSAGQGMVARFQSINQRLDDIRSGINQQISSEASKINSYVVQLKDLNQRIIVAQSAGSLQPANDLLDQRDQLVADLNKEIRITTHTETDGTVSVFFGSGQPLLVGSSSFKIYASPAQDDLTRMVVTLQDVNGSFTNIPEALVNGGNLGGLLQFRSETLDLAQNSLGRIATVFGSTFNAQHLLGQDMNGALGKNFFNVPQSGQLVLGNITNTGSAKVALTFDDFADLTASDYRLTMTAANTVTLLRTSDNKTWSGTGNNQAEAMASLMSQVNANEPQGFTLTLSGIGTMSIGDTFLIRPTRYGARDISMAVTDSRSIALAAPIRTAITASNAGTARISAGVVSDVAAGLSAPFNITYEAGPPASLFGFPVGASVDVAGQTYKITSPNSRVSYVSGSNISFNGVAISISDGGAEPADGDVFTIPPALFKPLFGNPTTDPLTGVALGGVPPKTPLTVIAGVNDRFDLAQDGGAPLTITLTPGTYQTPGAIAAQMQIDVNSALGVGSVTVTLAQNNLLQLTSATPGGSVDLTPYLEQVPLDLSVTPLASATLSNLGGGVLSAGVVSRTSSLPATPITLQYLEATTDPVTFAAIPARLTGLPVGSVVTVTPVGGGAATSYTILQATDYIPYTSESDIAFNGISFSISGIPINGDSFTIGPNPTGVSDNRNALLLGSLQTKNTIDGGTASYQTAYSQMVSQIGNKAREVQVASSAQDTLVKQGQDVIQSASGVNLDEEAANLIRYQQAYQASAKMIDVASKLFAEVLALGK